MLNLKSNVKYRAYNFSIIVINLVKGFPEKRSYWVLGDQLLRSVSSIGANLIEAKAASSRRDFIKFYQIALKSSFESKYWLCLLRDTNLTDKNKISTLITENNELSKMIGSSLLTLKNKNR